jgi:sulfur carrier protein ThiS
MRITVKGFNEIRPFTAGLPPEGTLQVEEGCSVRDVLDGLGIPAELQTKLVLFRNGRPAAPATKLREADQLVLFSPMTGG